METSVLDSQIDRLLVSKQGVTFSLRAVVESLAVRLGFPLINFLLIIDDDRERLLLRNYGVP